MSKYEKRLDSHELQLRIRYERAFHKSKVNWLQVKFHPVTAIYVEDKNCLLYTSPSPRDS